MTSTGTTPTLKTITYEVTDRVAVVTLNRPDRLNAFTGQMMRELIDAIDRVDADDDVRAVILTGAGRAFCAGFDFGGGFHHWDEQMTTDGKWDPGKDFAVTTAPTGAVPKFM